MGVNIDPKSEKCWKKGMLKTMPTFDAEMFFFAIFSGFWMDVLAMPGGKGGADT